MIVAVIVKLKDAILMFHSPPTDTLAWHWCCAWLLYSKSVLHPSAKEQFTYQVWKSWNCMKLLPNEGREELRVPKQNLQQAPENAAY